MVCGDSGRHIVPGLAHEGHGVTGGNVFQHNTQLREAFSNRRQIAVDKYFLAVEYVDVVIGDLTVNQQGQACLFHCRQRRKKSVQLGHARLGVGGRPGRVQLNRLHEVRRSGQLNLGSVGLICQVKGHQWFKLARQAIHGPQNPVPVEGRLGDRSGGWCQVGHDDHAPKIACHIGTGVLQGVTVTQVYMPVVRAGNGQFGHLAPCGL